MICSLPPISCTHQVEVGKDSGGTVLLGHEQQHLVVNKVTVLLERASQTQLQGLTDLQGLGGGIRQEKRVHCKASEGSTLTHLQKAEVRDWEWLSARGKQGEKDPKEK